MDEDQVPPKLDPMVQQWAHAIDALRLQARSGEEPLCAISIAARSAAIRWALETEIEALREAGRPDARNIIGQLEDLRAWAGAIAFAFRE